MKLKHFMLALVAMLSGFAFTANAQVKNVETLAELQAALLAGDNNSIVITTEIQIRETVVLDLNGKTVTVVYQKGSDSKHIYALNNYGNLTIKDTKGEGSIEARGIFVQNGSKLTVESGSIYGIDSNGGSALYQYGGDILIKGGHIEQKAEGTYNFAINALGGTVTVNGGWIGGNHGAIATEAAAVVINDGELVCTGTPGVTDNVLYTYGSGTIEINGGTFVADNDGPAGGCCMYDANGGATINGGTFGNSSGGDVWGTTGTTIKGGTFENLIETQHVTVGSIIVNGGKTYTKNEEGMEEVSYVAKIGTKGYATFAEALAAAKTMTGEVVVELFDKVTLNGPLTGNYSSIKFVGKNEKAEIYIDLQGYVEAADKEVAFEDLKLSKVAGGYIANAGFMNLAFGVYGSTEATYTNCTFLNGAYASTGNVTFTGCTFYRSHDRYGLWAYGAPNVTVEGCTFADIRGIKVYDEGKQQLTGLTVKNTDFSAVNNKPAIVLTSGKSVVLEGNTYNEEKGMLELDLDGNPNGTSVTSDVAPTCVNDNGACGVLVDGKIYTTVAQAKEVATSTSTVTLLHNSTETVEFPEGVTLDKNGFAAAGVTVAQPSYVAKIGEQGYATLQAAIEAVQEDETITVLNDITFTTGVNGSTNGISYTRGVSFELDLNGKTITSNLGNNALRFKIGDGNTVTNTEVTVLIKNGKIVSGSNNWCAISAATADNSGNKLILNLTDLKIEANKAGDFAVKSWAGAVVNTNNVDVTSNYAGGFYACGGEIVLDANSSVAQKGLHTAPYMSYAFGVSSGTGKMTVNGGTYSAVPAAASDGYNQGASHGSSVGGVMSSGGTLIINGGTFSNDNFGDAVPTAPRALLMADADAVVTINGGTFNAMAKIVDPTNNEGDASKNAQVTIKGGTYSANPTDAPYNLVKLAEGCAALPNLDGQFVVGAKPTATVNNLGMTTVAAGDYSIWDGSFDSNTEDDGAMPLSFVMQFLADQNGGDMANSPYADWYGDFVLTFTGLDLENKSFIANGCYLAGHYGSFGWVKVPVDGMTIEEGVRYPVMLGVGLGQKYDYICSSVEDFKCALYLTPEILAANPNIQVKLELGLVDNSKGSDAAANALINNENVYSVTEYTYDAEDFVAPVSGLTGEGTEANPYLIKTVEDLILFRNSVNAGETKYNAEGVYVALGANIDLAGQDWSVNIGDDAGMTFDGIFDGKGFTISNLTSTETAKKGDGYICTGLFGAIAGKAVVRNFTIENVTINAQYVGNNVAAVVGWAYNCTGSIENVTVTGNININAPNTTGVGAILGYDYYSPTLKVENCEVIGSEGSSIVGAAYVGGVVGYASNKIAMNGNTVEKLNITATSAAAGGVAGIMLAGGSAANNTVKNVNLASQHENWHDAVGIVAGTITTGKVTITNTTIDYVNTDAVAGAIHANKPITPVTKVEACIDNDYYTNFEGAYQAAQEGATITLLAPVVVAAGETLTLDKNVAINNTAKFDGALSISAGTYDADVTEFCAEGFICQDNGNGTYGVIADPNYIEELTLVDGQFTEYTYTAETKVGTFTYTRTFRNANVWNAIYLPFEIPVDMLVGNYDVAYINDVHSADENGDGEIAVSEMKMEVIKITNDAAILKANHPYLIRAKSDEAKVWTITLTDAILYPAVEETYECSSMYTTYSVTGTCRTRTKDELANSLVMSVNGAWVTSTTGMNPFRLCLTMTDRNGSPVKVQVDEQQAMRIRVRGEEDATGLESIELEQGTVFIYDLQGRRVLEPQKGNLYIVNGKKVIF